MIYKVGVIGSNSQVATEVCLSMRDCKEINLTCFVRSQYSSFLFDLFEIKWEKINFKDQKELITKINSFDIIIDFTYPSEDSIDILKTAKLISNSVLSSMKPNSIYIYMSSIMAHGMSNHDITISYKLIPRTTYSFIKRSIENYNNKLGKIYNINVFNLRLGQIHGFLQSVTKGYKKKCFYNEKVFVYGEKGDLLNIAFVETVNHAILKCIRREVNPGNYTIVENPQLTFEQIESFYNKLFNGNMSFNYLPFNNKPTISFLSSIFKVLKPYREFLETYVLFKLPRVAKIVKGQYRQVRVSTDFKTDMSNYPIEQHLTGKVPTEIIKVDNSFIDTYENLKVFINNYNSKIESYHK